jgi:hypothetical protein
VSDGFLVYRQAHSSDRLPFFLSSARPGKIYSMDREIAGPLPERREF